MPEVLSYEFASAIFTYGDMTRTLTCVSLEIAFAIFTWGDVTKESHVRFAQGIIP